MPTREVSVTPQPRSHSLSDSLRNAHIVDREGYAYFVHPVTDGVPRIHPQAYDAVIEALVQLVPTNTELLLTPEAMGIPLAIGVGRRLDLPVVVARKRSYKLAGEVNVHQETGYGSATLSINDVQEGERVVIVDDVISTGGTVRALARGLRTAGATLLAVVAVVEKHADLTGLAASLGCPVQALHRLVVNPQGVEVKA